MKRIYTNTKNVIFYLVTSPDKQKVSSKVQSHTNGTSGDHFNLKNLVLAQNDLISYTTKISTVAYICTFICTSKTMLIIPAAE